MSSRPACFPSFQGLPAGLGTLWLWLPLSRLCLRPHVAVFPACLSLCLFSPSYRGPTLLQGDLILTEILMTSAKTLFPDKVTFIITRLGLQHMFMGTPFNTQ